MILNFNSATGGEDEAKQRAANKQKIENFKISLGSKVTEVPKESKGQNGYEESAAKAKVDDQDGEQEASSKMRKFELVNQECQAESVETPGLRDPKIDDGNTKQSAEKKQRRSNSAPEAEFHTPDSGGASSSTWQGSESIPARVNTPKVGSGY